MKAGEGGRWGSERRQLVHAAGSRRAVYAMRAVRAQQASAAALGARVRVRRARAQQQRCGGRCGGGGMSPLAFTVGR